jgi:hypothetical protein
MSFASEVFDEIEKISDMLDVSFDAGTKRAVGSFITRVLLTVVQDTGLAAANHKITFKFEGGSIDVGPSGFTPPYEDKDLLQMLNYLGSPKEKRWTKYIASEALNPSLSLEDLTSGKQMEAVSAGGREPMSLAISMGSKILSGTVELYASDFQDKEYAENALYVFMTRGVTESSYLPAIEQDAIMWFNDEYEVVKKD